MNPFIAALTEIIERTLDWIKNPTELFRYFTQFDVNKIINNLKANTVAFDLRNHTNSLKTAFSVSTVTGVIMQLLIGIITLLNYSGLFALFGIGYAISSFFSMLVSIAISIAITTLVIYGLNKYPYWNSILYKIGLAIYSIYSVLCVIGVIRDLFGLRNGLALGAVTVLSSIINTVMTVLITLIMAEAVPTTGADNYNLNQNQMGQNTGYNDYRQVNNSNNQNQNYYYQNQSYTGQNQSYTGQNQSYTGQNQSYTGQNQSYTGQNQEYDFQPMTKSEIDQEFSFDDSWDIDNSNNNNSGIILNGEDSGMVGL